MLLSFFITIYFYRKGWKARFSIHLYLISPVELDSKLCRELLSLRELFQFWIHFMDQQNDELQYAAYHEIIKTENVRPDPFHTAFLVLLITFLAKF